MEARQIPVTESTAAANPPPHVLMAMELSNKTWLVRFGLLGRTGTRDVRVPARNRKMLLDSIAAARQRLRVPADSPVTACYEAGRDGFWLSRFLEEHGVRCLIIESASIEVNRRRRRAKSDGIDVAMLFDKLGSYLGGDRRVFHVVTVPTVEAEDARRPDRERDMLVGQRTSEINRIRSWLCLEGLELPEDRSLRRALEGVIVPLRMREALDRAVQRVEYISAQIQDLEHARRERLKVGVLQGHASSLMIVGLMGLCGIGEQGACRLTNELFGWRPYRNRRDAGSLVGLTPTPWSSGDMNRELGISKAGNPRLRGLLVELSWQWLRYQPRSKLSLWYQARFGGAGTQQRKKGIVALSRRLLVDLWRYAVSGGMPEGARLKALVVL